MQISSFRQNTYYPRPAIQIQSSSPSFGQALDGLGSDDSRKETKALSIEVSTPSAISTAASSISTGTSSDTRKPDYTSMTPRAFSNAAQGMYDRGEIDLDALFKMQFAAGGIFKDTPYSDSESTQPANYVKHFQDQLSMGTSFFGAYGSKKIADIVNILTRAQTHSEPECQGGGESHA